ncbi:hypothetical protein AC578_7608 [Pseudocercospora eumusae]|uniref:Uncharacterized protein n=1 Tax=Pseudocercospora eumusae TaxID=321146 RepID=A0A139GUY6_9PEZI|nr:hypothetical protein AC578_7608 [Pseudocercospora eumusae]
MPHALSILAPSAILPPDIKTYLFRMAILNVFSSQNLPSVQTLLQLLSVAYPIPSNHLAVVRSRLEHLLDWVIRNVTTKATGGISHALLHLAYEPDFCYEHVLTKAASEHARLGHRFVAVQHPSTIGKEELLNLAMSTLCSPYALFHRSQNQPASYTYTPQTAALCTHSSTGTSHHSQNQTPIPQTPSSHLPLSPAPQHYPNSSSSIPSILEFQPWRTPTQSQMGSISSFASSSEGNESKQLSAEEIVLDADEERRRRVAFRACLDRIHDMLLSACRHQTPYPECFFEFLRWNGNGLEFVVENDYAKALEEMLLSGVGDGDIGHE